MMVRMSQRPGAREAEDWVGQPHGGQDREAQQQPAGAAAGPGRPAGPWYLEPDWPGQLAPSAPPAPGSSSRPGP